MMTVFEQAAAVYDGWVDKETGLRVLKIEPRDAAPATKPSAWRTLYHQNPCFMDGGRRVLLRQTARGAGQYLVDLTTGEHRAAAPEGLSPVQLSLASHLMLSVWSTETGPRIGLWDLDEGREVCGFSLPGWRLWTGRMMLDGRSFLVGFYQGQYYDEHCRSVFYHIQIDAPPVQILEADGFFCNHIMVHPTDPELYAYDRWPSPKRDTEVVLHIRNLAGDFETPLPQLPTTVRPGKKWGCQRDHYLWSPDGRRLLSYFSPENIDSDDHFDFGWWLSATDWQTGEDFSVKYPEERWGCNFAVSPDSRYVVSAGGRGFEKLYIVDIEGLATGWNEQVLCTYPHGEEDGHNNGPFHMPAVLPDQSGVLFSAGFGQAEDGCYLVEWPRC